MKKVLIFTMLILLLVGSVWAQPTPPATPPTPESQGIQIPQASSSSQAPPSSESDQTLIATSEASAKAAAPSHGTESTSYKTTTPTYGATAGSSSYANTYMVVPPGIQTVNRFYIPYTPSTVAGCNFGQWLPVWMDVRGWGPLYMYEWYPDGRLVTDYLAYVQYPGWQKMWFYGDAPGWHTLQYYCNGWSNYIYVYVYDQPYYPPYEPYYPPYDSGYYPPTPYPPTPEPGCNAQIVIISEYMRGYSVNVDGNYIGGDGRRGDHFDGIYSFTVTGGQPHTITVDNDGAKFTQTKTYSCGQTYTWHI